MSQSNDRERAASEEPDPIDAAAQAWFWLLSSGNATAADRAGFAAWQDADPRHRAVYEELCLLWADIDELREAFAAPPGPASLPENRRRPAAPRAGGFASRLGRRAVLWGGVAAALAIAAVFAAPQLSLRYQADHLTAVGEQARVVLPDGSLAWLNTATALAVDYGEERRTVTLLRGEAQFEVAEDAERPFDVLAQAGRSRALGTVFAVRDLGSGATVTVAEGLVEVVSPAPRAPRSGGARSGGRVLLSAGRQVDYREGEGPGEVRTVSAAAMTAWRDGVVAVEGLAFERALTEIDRYRPGRILLWADAGALQPVTARLSLAALDEGLDALAATHGLSVTRVTDYLVILR
ncbi:FecR domain-containing protein [Algihabitans albus]|uniref:FecR family protein n=1 Tax=Algihabitans albus TaxID=2164067 RepID=UPI0035D0ABF2